MSDSVGGINKLIKYNTNDGQIKNGILLSRDFGANGELQMLVPISEGLHTIETLAIDSTFQDHKLGVRFTRISNTQVQVFFNKKEHREPPLNPELRKLILRAAGQEVDELPNFVQNAGEMTGIVPNRNMEAFLKILDTYDIKLAKEARELKAWEIENLEDWKQRTTEGDAHFHYELGRAYGQGSNPQTGFKAYEEPNRDYPFGRVSYDRRLSDKEKYRYSLIPIYQTIEAPFSQWKQFVEKTALQKDYERIMEEAKNLPLHKAKDAIGNFIYNHPHEDGNSEFVFGRYDARELGTVAYREEIASISELDELIDQLRLARRVAPAG